MPRVIYQGDQPLSLHPQHGEILRISKGHNDLQGSGRDLYPGELVEVEHLFGKAYLAEQKPGESKPSKPKAPSKPAAPPVEDEAVAPQE